MADCLEFEALLNFKSLKIATTTTKKASLTLSFSFWRGILHDLKLAMWPFLSAFTS